MWNCFNMASSNDNNPQYNCHRYPKQSYLLLPFFKDESKKKFATFRPLKCPQRGTSWRLYYSTEHRSRESIRVEGARGFKGLLWVPAGTSSAHALQCFCNGCAFCSALSVILALQEFQIRYVRITDNSTVLVPYMYGENGKLDYECPLGKRNLKTLFRTVCYRTMLQ